MPRWSVWIRFCCGNLVGRDRKIIHLLSLAYEPADNYLATVRIAACLVFHRQWPVLPKRHPINQLAPF